MTIKQCVKCKKTKEPGEFRIDTSRVDGLYPYCLECNRIYEQIRYKKDIEKSRKLCRDRMRRFRKKKENQEKAREYSRKYYHENKLDCMKRRKAWRKPSSGRKSVMLGNQKRRKANNETTMDLSKNDIEFLLLLQNNECAKCNKEFSKKFKYTLDHIVPLSRGGSLVLENTQLLCRPCNSSKHDKIEMYRPKINFYCLSFI